MSFPRYPTYEDSGVEWLGQVPGHWQVLPCRAIVQERTAKNEGAECEDYLSLMANIGVMPYAEKGDVGNKKPEDLSKCKIVTEGDLVINSMNYGIGSYGLSAYSGVCSPVYIVLKPRNDVIESRFAFRIFENKAFQTFAQSYGNGILEHRCAINWDILKSIGVPVPPHAEQQAILTFLDRETAKIDALVAEQRQLMALLKEKRQAVISHAVTQGLNPHAPMKPTGIDWLGDVPEHWGIGSLGYLSSIQTGSTPDRAKPEYWGGDIPWLKTGEINYERILDSEERITEVGLANSAARIAEVGTLMMAMYGQGVTRGRVAILGIRAAYNQACAAITFGPKLVNEYARYFFMMAYRFIRDTGNETSQMNLGSGTIAKIKILIPPLEEQRQIVSLLQIELSVFDTLATEAQRAIDLLQERRTALISAAVTGQIDMRSAAAC